MEMKPGSDHGRAFILQSRAYLSEEYLPKVLACLRRLPAEDLWWRPNPTSNSVGNLCWHRAGIVRLWVVSGIGGRPDLREREREFGATEGWTSDRLAGLLEEVLGEVDGVLGGLREERLRDTLTIQGLETTVMGALFHAVEHFSGHTAQISYITKMKTGQDLGFYHIDSEGRVHTRWGKPDESPDRRGEGK